MNKTPFDDAFQVLRRDLLDIDFMAPLLDRGMWPEWLSTALQGVAWAVGDDTVKIADAAQTDGGVRIVALAERFAVIADFTGAVDVEVQRPDVKVRIVPLARPAEVSARVELARASAFDGRGVVLVGFSVTSETGEVLALPLDGDRWGPRKRYADAFEALRSRLA